MRRSLMAWYMKRLLIQMPAPWSRCCVTVALKVELSSGLYDRERAVGGDAVLMMFACRAVPVTKPWL